MRRASKSIAIGLLASLVLSIVGGFQTSQADQNHSNLDALFQELKQTQGNYNTQFIEARIWEAWLEAPDQNATSLMSQITTAMSINRLELALRLNDQLIDSNPDFAEAWNKRATIHYLVGNHEQSVADIKQTLLLEPRHFGALSGLGLIFLSADKVEAAVDAYEAVLELNPASDNAKANVERAKAMLGSDI